MMYPTSHRLRVIHVILSEMYRTLAVVVDLN